MAWLMLLAAGLLEIAWAVGLKHTEGFTRPAPSVVTIAAMVLSMGLLGLALRHLPIGTAYAVWTGIGTLGYGAGGHLAARRASDRAAAGVPAADPGWHSQAEACSYAVATWGKLLDCRWPPGQPGTSAGRLTASPRLTPR